VGGELSDGGLGGERHLATRHHSRPKPHRGSEEVERTDDRQVGEERIDCAELAARDALRDDLVDGREELVQIGDAVALETLAAVDQKYG
jgi:hypothetical protein